MLQLDAKQIFLQQKSTDKHQAIEAIAQHLINAGNVEAGYVKGMLAREAQNSTYLGNGIAIPHGTTDTRDLVKQTGFILHHFSEGLEWDAGNMVYLVIGIAAKSDEHLTILKQLTRVLSEDGVEEALKNVKETETIIAILNGTATLLTGTQASLQTSPQTRKNFIDQLVISPALVQTQFPARDMIQLQAVAAGLLQQDGRVERAFISDFVSRTPVQLTEGVWLLASQHAVIRSGIAAVSSENAFEYEQKSAQLLIAIASQNQAHLSVLNQIAKLIQNGNLSQLTNANAVKLIAELTGQVDTENTLSATAQSIAIQSTTEASVEAVMTINNPHGLHARPSAALVNEAKKYDATITVENVTQSSESVNAKSLMKIMTLGVKSGNQLKFVATGEDAQAAIDGIKAAIASGLGE